MKKVIVIGAGYGGLRAIEGLENDSTLDITLIDKNPYHYLQTEAYAYVAGQADVGDVIIDLDNWCNGFHSSVNFIHAEVTKIDYDTQSVELRNGKSMVYDYIIVATGARTNFFSFIPGLAEHSHGIKSLHSAYTFRKGFGDLLHEKIEKNTQKKLTIAIGGAGLSGVEIAAEMAYVIQSYSKNIGESAKEIEIALIDASETILPGMGEYVIAQTQKRLHALGVNILTNAFIDKVDETFIHFKGGETLEYSFMIFTGGIKAMVPDSNIEYQQNRVNQLIVNEYLNIGKYANAYAIGDCVEIHDSTGNILPPTAQIAERSAEYVAEAIINPIGELKPFSASVLGVFVALGGKYAVGEMFGKIKIKGYLAYLMKKGITFTYHRGLSLRINAGYKIRSKN
jgi:NADH dehydrogenase